MASRTSKFLAIIVMFLTCAAVYAFLPHVSSVGAPGEARVCIALIAMVIAKAVTEYLLGRRQKKDDGSHDKDDDHVA